MEVSINQKINCELKFSYIEIYNEQVNDLLNKDKSAKKCKVREHPTTGPYVENVKEQSIESYDQFLKLLNLGNSQRSTAATSMNDKSSRSHAIITLTLKQTKFENCSAGDLDETSSIGEASEEMISNIKLVDLAGSERLQKTKVYGQQDRIKEGTLINKSLAVLGRCINLLSGNPSSVVPYRESVLTYLLKENLAGNSKTCMICCVSPIDYDESHQTLIYANEVKKIKTLAKANKTKLSNVPINWQQLQQNDQTVIDSLRTEIETLTNKLNQMETSTQISNPISNMIEYLEKESSKVKFENKYLKQLMNKKNSHIKELNNHIDFISNEYQLLFNDYKALQQAKIRTAKQGLLKECDAHTKTMELELAEFELIDTAT
ncbi:kif1 Kinesin-related protein 1 [Candida maltosa Xu316]